MIKAGDKQALTEMGALIEQGELTREVVEGCVRLALAINNGGDSTELVAQAMTDYHWELCVALNQIENLKSEIAAK